MNVFHVAVDGGVRIVQAPKKMLWDMIDSDIAFRNSGKQHDFGNLCFRLEFLGVLMNHPAFSDIHDVDSLIL